MLCNGKWEFNHYFEKLGLVLLYCYFYNIQIDSFPPKLFFEHGEYSLYDEFNLNANKFHDTDHIFIKRFVPSDIIKELEKNKKEIGSDVNLTDRVTYKRHQKKFQNENQKSLESLKVICNIKGKALALSS